VEIILEEEEELINGHRQHIDDVVDLVKQVKYFEFKFHRKCCYFMKSTSQDQISKIMYASSTLSSSIKWT